MQNDNVYLESLNKAYLQNRKDFEAMISRHYELLGHLNFELSVGPLKTKRKNSLNETLAYVIIAIEHDKSELAKINSNIERVNLRIANCH